MSRKTLAFAVLAILILCFSVSRDLAAREESGPGPVRAAVSGDPLKDSTVLEQVRFVMKGEVVYKDLLPGSGGAGERAPEGGAKRVSPGTEGRR